MMITGAHSIIYSDQPEADRKFLQEILGLPYVDVGRGWLIFGLPPAEIAVHPGESNDRQELYFMCENIIEFVSHMDEHNIKCDVIEDQGWGMLTRIRLPGGGKIGVYQPRHPRPENPIL